jgi:bacillithiol biosynthesis cysteine-adding enzyme BshC
MMSATDESHCIRLDYSAISVLDSLLQDYLQAKAPLQALYTQVPQIESFAAQIARQSFSLHKRQILGEVLEAQYAAYTLSPAARQNLEALKQEGTFTITTGHQLNIFGGPLYFIYKIISAIRTCQELQKAYPQQRFVPVFWMASEDHDFAEIASFHLFGKRYTWSSEGKSGAVGRLSPKSLADILEALPEAPDFFREAYLQQNTLADATRYFVNTLFGQYGLLCLDADHPRLKALWTDLVREELYAQPTFQKVTQSAELLAKHQYKVQVNPREINLFYLDEGLRERIIAQGEGFAVLNTDLYFSKEAMEKLLQESPEKISPNVLLRPVYQQCILPNLAYIGGGGELAYWLELQSTFAHFATKDSELCFPILMLRNMALLLNGTHQKRFEKLGLTAEELFLDEVGLRKAWVERNSSHELSLQSEKEALETLFEAIRYKASLVDKSLEGVVGAEMQKSIKSLEMLEKRLQKAEEKQQETQINQLSNLKEKLFPEGKLQERYDNFLNFYLNDPQFIEKLMEIFQPFEQKMYVIWL